MTDTEVLNLLNEMERFLEPMPIDPYELSLWYLELAAIFENCYLHFQREGINLQNAIWDQKVPSENYDIEQIFESRKTTDVNWQKLKEQRPDDYIDCLTLKASDAEKLIGKEELEALVIDIKGVDTFLRSANPSLGKLRKILPKPILKDYITEYFRPAGFRITKRDDAAELTEGSNDGSN